MVPRIVRTKESSGEWRERPSRPPESSNGIKTCSLCRQPAVRRPGVEGNTLPLRTVPVGAGEMAQPFKARLMTKNLRPASTRSLSKHLPPHRRPNVQISHREGMHAGPRGKCPAAEPQAASDSEGHRTGSSSPSRHQGHVPSDEPRQMNLPLHLGNTFHFLYVCGVCSHTCANSVECFLSSLLLKPGARLAASTPARSNSASPQRCCHRLRKPHLEFLFFFFFCGC